MQRAVVAMRMQARVARHARTRERSAPVARTHIRIQRERTAPPMLRGHCEAALCWSGGGAEFRRRSAPKVDDASDSGIGTRRAGRWRVRVDSRCRGVARIVLLADRMHAAPPLVQLAGAAPPPLWFPQPCFRSGPLGLQIGPMRSTASTVNCQHGPRVTPGRRS